MEETPLIVTPGAEEVAPEEVVATPEVAAPAEQASETPAV